ERHLINISLVVSDVELGPDFARRPFGDREELAELGRAAAFEALGDVRHDGDGGPSDLVPEGVVVRERTMATDLVNLVGQPAGPLPGVNLLKPLDGRHVAPI